MSKDKIKIPKDKAHGTCHATMSAWRAMKVEKTRRASRSGTAGKGKIKFIKAPATGWVGGMPEQNGWRPGGRK